MPVSPAQKPAGLSVFFPAYNDRGTIAKCGQRVRALRSNGKPKIEVTGATTSAADASRLFSELVAGHWLTYVIIAEGNHIRHFVNGTLLSEVVDDQEGKAAAAGVLAIQLHSGPPMKVQVKDIRVNILK